MFWRWLRAVLILPLNVLVVIPGGLLWLFRGGRWTHHWAAWNSGAGIAALVLGAAGLGLALWTVALFMRFGGGTAAPWDPPQRFVVRGPYIFVRNPMIVSVFMMQSAEAIKTGSWPVFGWLLAFVTLNLFYIPLVEERGLQARFGEDYRRYKESVPRWIPRLPSSKIPIS